MEPLEQTMATLLQGGASPKLADFGGLLSVVSGVEAVSAGKFSAEFVEMALDQAGDDPEAQRFAAGVIERAQDDFSIGSLVEILQFNQLPDTIEERIFGHWLSLSQNGIVTATVRTAALLGALILKRGKSRRALRLAAAIASATTDEDPFYLSHAARIGGFLHAEQPHQGIIEFLHDVAEVDEASDEANFEIGLYKVGEALGQKDPGEAKQLLRSARIAFDIAANLRESRYDAKAFSLALTLLEGFYNRRPASEMKTWASELKKESFAHSAYVYGAEENPLLGSRGAQIAAWSSLGIRIARLSDEIDQPVWLDGIRIVEEELLSVYTASRTILGMQKAGTVEAIVSPRIQSSLLDNKAQAMALRRWLSENPSSIQAAAAAELISLTDDYVTGNHPPNPLEAASGSPLLAALQARAKDLGASDATFKAILKIVEIESSKVSHAVMECLDAVTTEFMAIEMFAKYTDVMEYFLALTFKTMLFVEHRLNATAAQDPSGAYLFENPGGETPLEKHLQQDYLRFLRSSKLGTHDEVRGLASGRADVFHDFGRVQIVTEIKRESDDASFGALLSNYGEQASAYQNSNVPVGILLVLDLTRSQSAGEHISALYKPAVGDFLKDGVPRGVLAVKISGNRISPAVATARGQGRDRNAGVLLAATKRGRRPGSIGRRA